MANTYCKFIPTVNKKRSNLFTDLTSNIKDRNMVKAIYSVVTAKTFIDHYGENLLFDENNEPTFESVSKFLNLENMNSKAKMKQLETLMNNSLSANIKDNIKTVVDFNKQNKNFVAEIYTDSYGKDHIVIHERSTETNEKAKQLDKAFSIYNKIENFLKRLNIPITILDANLFNGESGLMIPENLNKLTDGLFGVINIANNYQGFKTLTEEFSHFIVENLKSNPLIQRAENFLSQNNQLVREILGNDYDKVSQYYTNRDRQDLIVREALGRLVADIINNKKDTTTLFDRVKKLISNFIKEHFRISDELYSSIDEIKSDLEDLVNETLADKTINDETLKFFKKFGDTLAHTANNIDNLQKMFDDAANNILANLAKYITVYRPDKENALQSTLDVERQLRKLSVELRQTNVLSGILEFANESVRILRNNENQLREFARMSNFSTSQLKKASEMMQIKNLIETYRDPVIDYLNICDEIIERERGLVEKKFTSSAEQLKLILQQAQDCINATERVFVKVNRKFLASVLQPYFKAGEITYPTKDGETVTINLATILDCSMGDINALNRYLLSAANTDDFFVGLVDNFIRTQQELVRQKSLEKDHQIRSIDLSFRKQQHTHKTDFMFEFNEKGVPTGYYRSPYNYTKFINDRNAEKERLEKLNLSEEEVDKKMTEWDIKHTKVFPEKIYRKNYKGELVESNRVYHVPNDDYANPNYLAGLSQAQIEYYHKFMKMKWELDLLLPQSASSPYRCVQMRMGSIGEAIATSRQGITGNFTNALSAIKNQYFATTELDCEEYDGLNALQRIIKKLKIKNDKQQTKTTRFDNTPYQQVPIYFTEMLDDLSQLSTDATTTLREYSLMAINYSELHKQADIIELIREQNKERTVYEEVAKEEFQLSDEESVSRRTKIPTQSSNTYNRVEDMILMNFYGQNKNQGFAITENISTGKVVDTLMRFTSFTLLGYNAFTGINNSFVGKYQMFIESMGGQYFNMRDWGKAEKEYWKMVPKLLEDLYLPYSTSKMSLIQEKFNSGMHWKENIKDSKSFRNAITNVTSKLNSNFMMDMGEHNIQMTTTLAYLIGYKLYASPVQFDENGQIKNNDYISLYDAMDVELIKDDHGNTIDSKLILKDKYKDYYTIENKHFDFSDNSKDIAYHSLLIGKLNQDMHGIYNKEDMMVAKKYAIGRLMTMYRNHIVPQMQKRFKSLGKHRGIYNFRSNQIEEGYYVTAFRVLRDLLLPKQSNKFTQDEIEKNNIFALWGILKKNLSTYQKSNLKKFFAEMGLLSTLALLSILAKLKWDDDDEDTTWIQRQWFYQLKRLQLEGTAYFPTTMLSSFMQILISPTAVISPIERYVAVLNNLPNHHKILKSGPYKGHSRLYAACMRAIPIYPQVKSFMSLAKNDSRFKIFESGMTETAILNILEDE